jgi:hypothetical protein
MMLRIEFEIRENADYYRDIEQWYPSVHYDLEFYPALHRSLAIYFGRFKFILEWGVNPDNYFFDKYDRAALHDSYNHAWFFMDVVDWFTGRDRAAEAKVKFEAEYGKGSWDE